MNFHCEAFKVYHYYYDDLEDTIFVNLDFLPLNSLKCQKKLAQQSSDVWAMPSWVL